MQFAGAVIRGAHPGSLAGYPPSHDPQVAHAAATRRRLGGRRLGARRLGARVRSPALPTRGRCIFHHDPVGINLEENTDEYDAEAERIILTLATTPKPRSVEQLQDMIHRVFVQCFGEKTAGPAPRYRPIAQEVWARRGNWPGGAPDSALPPPDPPARV
jgi:hypothetical protein